MYGLSRSSSSRTSGSPISETHGLANDSVSALTQGATSTSTSLELSSNATTSVPHTLTLNDISPFLKNAVVEADIIEEKKTIVVLLSWPSQGLYLMMIPRTIVPLVLVITIMMLPPGAWTMLNPHNFHFQFKETRKSHLRPNPPTYQSQTLHQFCLPKPFYRMVIALQQSCQQIICIDALFL